MKATALVLLGCALLATGCATEMTVADFVHRRFLPDEKVQAVNAAAETACQAYDFQLKTPIASADENFRAKFIELVNAAHDKWRLSRAVRITELSPTMPYTDSIRLKNLGKAEYYVPIGGASCAMYRVKATATEVNIVGLVTTGGAPILFFDSMLNPTVDNEFGDYLRGDRIDVKGAATIQLDRSGKNVQRANVVTPGVTEPEQRSPLAAPANGPGCSKDNDCKGARVCVRGECVNP